MNMDEKVAYVLQDCAEMLGQPVSDFDAWWDEDSQEIRIRPKDDS